MIGHSVFEGLQGGQLVGCRADRADPTDQIRHLIVATADNQRFKETRRLEQAHLDIIAGDRP